MRLNSEKSSSPQLHVSHIVKALHEIEDHCRSDLKIVKDKRARELFETTAETLAGIESAFKKFRADDETSGRKIFATIVNAATLFLLAGSVVGLLKGRSALIGD